MKQDMRALLSEIAGGPETLAVSKVPRPVPGPGQLLVEIQACGVNFPDALIIEDRYQYRPQRPFSPGAEIAGVVVAAGEGVRAFACGDRVFAMCGWGGMAEHVAIDAAKCLAMPPEMSFEDAGAFIMTYGTAYHALVQRGALAAGERVLILGAGGGVGLAATQIAAALGASVTAAASTQEKVGLAKAHGARLGVVYPRSSHETDQQRLLAAAFKEAGEGAGFDIVVDTVGGDIAEPAIRALAWKGRFLTIGFPAGIPRIALNLLLLKGAAAIGVFYGAFTEQESELNRKNDAVLLALYREGKIKPLISARYSLDEAGRAIADIAAGAGQGKLVVLPRARAA